MVERDRDESGRPRSTRPRDALGRPLPQGSDGVPRIPDDLELPPAETLAYAQDLLDKGLAFNAHEVLDREVDALVEVMLAKNPATLQVTKYFLDKGADLDLANSMIFEVAPPRQLERQGIADFVEKGSRDQRRKLVMNFWQD